MAREASGSVRYRGGRWWARVTVGDDRPLLPIEPPITDPRARAAAKAEAAILSKLARAMKRPKPVAGGELVRDWYDRWLAARDENGHSTREARSHLKTHILEEIGDVAMRDLKPSDLERVVRRLDRLVNEGELRWKSALNIWGTVTVACDDATRGKVAELRCFEEDPSKKVRGPDRGVETEKVHLFPGELLQLMKCRGVPQLRRRAYTIGVYLYLRPAELEALTWEDIDLPRGQVTIQRSIDRESGEVGSPKAGKARATHDLEPTIIPLLRAMHRKGATGPVVGRLGDERELAQQLRRDLLDAGVARTELHFATDDPPREWMRMHDLRTTGVTWMAVRGDEPMMIMARAGHADLKTTLGYVSRSALVRRGYGAVFPAIPAELLKDQTAPQSAPQSIRRGNSRGVVAEAHGNRTGLAANDQRDLSAISLAKLRVVTSEDAAKSAIAGRGADSGADWNEARKVLVYRLAEALKRACERGDHDAAWRLHDEIARAMPQRLSRPDIAGPRATPAPRSRGSRASA